MVKTIPDELARVIAGLLDYSFQDILFSWSELTARERHIIGTPANFALLVQFIRENQR